MEAHSRPPQGSVKRLIVPIGLLALYPLLILALQFASTPEPRTLDVDLLLDPVVLEDGRATVSVAAENAEDIPVDVSMLMVNLMRGAEPERTVIEDRLGLEDRLGGPATLPPRSRTSLGTFDLGSGRPAAMQRVVQVSLTLVDPVSRQPRHVTRDAVLNETP